MVVISMKLKNLSIKEIEENLHQMRMLQMHSFVMQADIKKAIDTSIEILNEELRTRKCIGLINDNKEEYA